MVYPYQIRTLQQYHRARQDSLANPEAFWADIAQHFTWIRPWNKVLEWNFDEPSVRWFDGAQLNIPRTASTDTSSPMRANLP